MSGYIEGVSRDQVTLFPDRLDDWIDDDHPARVIEAFVDAMDLAGAGFVRMSPAQTGRPSYHPFGIAKAFHLWLPEPHPFKSEAGT